MSTCSNTYVWLYDRFDAWIMLPFFCLQFLWLYGASANKAGLLLLLTMCIQLFENRHSASICFIFSIPSAYLHALSGFTPLHVAVAQNLVEIAETLIRHNADPSAPNAQGESSLHVAATYGLVNMTSLLLRYVVIRYLTVFDALDIQTGVLCGSQKNIVLVLRGWRRIDTFFLRWLCVFRVIALKSCAGRSTAIDLEMPAPENTRQT